MQNGVYPEKPKVSVITPLFKKGGKDQIIYTYRYNDL